ncbi:cyclophilin family peptidyl-prolyl cis-trans isomerase [Gelidibacter sediminis]|uniref:Peptidyl-prolyl cis-trans isomerase n=1 Tax=Gelidibacter sediminis TaxID=1608710 RepID=A0A4R7PXC1_9FLAO|nr:peptidylprolyl isomerase [Gelidibacter sediminis]TDU39595.1 cyclophilin family peptidyl-prolyl cis-trans isomerase [Gelidibacter sediminis]
MRILVFIGVFFVFLNCEDKQSRQKENNSSADSLTTSTLVERKKEPKKNQREYPKLNDKNAMEFFLQYDKKHKENKVRITTDFGTIDILLYDETKFHRANFIFLTKQGYFDNTQFYRIVNNFIIQGGSSDDIAIAEKRRKIGQYLLPTDTNRGFVHNRGAISMPSSAIENPYKLASPYQFFIVQQQGGAHHLDGDYTVFGRVTDGMDVVDKIASQETDGSEWPLKNIYIRKVEIIN